MKLLLIPLDERPCNYKYPAELLTGVEDIDLSMPDRSILGKEKEPANLDALWQFVEDELPSCDAAILSMDMMLYGGLLHSRLHTEPLELLLDRIDRLTDLHANYPKAKLYGFDCIMRIPSYNGAGEEPDYYGIYGRRIFELSVLKHKKALGILDEQEKAQYPILLQQIPEDVLSDYFGRRKKNQKVTSYILDHIKDGLFEQFMMPQDDASVYGVQAMEQQAHIKKTRDLEIQTKVYVYPGADEAGLTLLSKAIIDARGNSPSVYIRYNSLLGRAVIPAFEDRPYEETIKWHLLSAGLTTADSSSEADIILMVNVPGKEQHNAGSQRNNYRENSSLRNMLEFVRTAKYYLQKGKEVAVADVAYANGGDLDLLKLLKLEHIQDKLTAYAGWNTNANTLGTVICFAVISHFYCVNRKFMIYRIMEDCGYQAEVREDLYRIYEPEKGFSCQEKLLTDTALKKLEEFSDEYLCDSFKELISLQTVSFPWRRLFEIELHY